MNNSFNTFILDQNALDYTEIFDIKLILDVLYTVDAAIKHNHLMKSIFMRRESCDHSGKVQYNID